MRAKAIIFEKKGVVAIGETQIPGPGAGEVLIKTLFTSVSPGTELRCLIGDQPNTTFPFIPGYSLVGKVVACGPTCTIEPGAIVFCRGTERASHRCGWGGHVEYAVCKEARVFHLPENLDHPTASFLKLVSIALHGISRAVPRPGELAIVVGMGIIGQISARLCLINGLEVIVVDRREDRIALAPSGVKACPLLKEFFAGRGADPQINANLVIDTTGNPSILSRSLSLAKEWHIDSEPYHFSRIVLQGTYLSSLDFAYRQAFTRNLSIIVPKDHADFHVFAAQDLLNRGMLNLAFATNCIVPVARAPDIYSQLLAKERGVLTGIFDWS